MQFVRAYEKRRGPKRERGLMAGVNKMEDTGRLVIKELRKGRRNKDKCGVNGEGVRDGHGVTA